MPFDAEPAVIATELFGPLVLPPALAAQADELRDLAARAAAYAVRAKGEGTRRAYRAAWRRYTAWCEALGLQPLAADPGLVSMYLTRLADSGLAPATIRVHLAAAVTAHRMAGLSLDTRDPRLLMIVEGIVRAKGTAPQRQACPLTRERLKELVAACADDPQGRRDRCLLLIGFGAALRRSELVALAIADTRVVDGKGLLVTVRRSKTDQRGEGALVGIRRAADPALDVVAALERWLAVRGARHPEDPLFVSVTKGGAPTGQRLSDRAVALVVKRRAAALGLDPTLYAGHSLRAGLATTAAENEAQLHDIMRQTRHKSTDVARRYLRDTDVWKNNVTDRIFGDT